MSGTAPPTEVVDTVPSRSIVNEVAIRGFTVGFVRNARS
jgi:hypothetical protein